MISISATARSVYRQKELYSRSREPAPALSAPNAKPGKLDTTRLADLELDCRVWRVQAQFLTRLCAVK